MDNKSFDKIVSLGYNCEVSSRIKDIVKGDFNSYPFSWTYIVSIPKFINALNNLDDILKNNIEVQKNGMVKDTKYDIFFHLKNTNQDFDTEEKKLKAQINELKSRFNHLIHKFKKLLNSNLKTLFILKYRNHEEPKYYFDIIKYLMNNYKTKKFKVLIVCEKQIPIEFEQNHDFNNFVTFRKINSFAKDTETETGGDIKGWHEAIRSIIGEKVYKSKNLKKAYNYLKENGFRSFFRKLFKHN